MHGRKVGFILGIGGALAAWGQGSAAQADPSEATGVQAPAASTAPGALPTTPSAQQVIEELLRQRQETPAMDPVRPTVSPAPAAGPITDRRVLGVAPDTRTSSPALRREGDFVLGRRGRFIRDRADQPPLFVFAADGPRAAEPPLKLAPSQLTEQVEKILDQRGERGLYIVTGQVLTYRGANYLLLTLVMEDFEQGNLKP